VKHTFHEFEGRYIERFWSGRVVVPRASVDARLLTAILAAVLLAMLAGYALSDLGHRLVKPPSILGTVVAERVTAEGSCEIPAGVPVVPALQDLRLELLGVTKLKAGWPAELSYRLYMKLDVEALRTELRLGGNLSVVGWGRETCLSPSDRYYTSRSARSRRMSPLRGQS